MINDNIEKRLNSISRRMLDSLEAELDIVEMLDIEDKVKIKRGLSESLVKVAKLYFQAKEASSLNDEDCNEISEEDEAIISEFLKGYNGKK